MGWQSAVLLKSDVSTRAMEIIDYDHHEVHAGSAFSCHYSNDCTNTGEMTLIAFNTPNTASQVHVIFEASSTAGAYMAIYEDADLDAGEGTDLAIWNRNRNSTATSGVTSVESPAVAGGASSFNEAQAGGATLSTASEIYRYYLGAGTTGTDQAGQARGASEWILKKNTQYAFAVVSTTNDDNTHNLVLHWYEHTPKG